MCLSRSTSRTLRIDDLSAGIGNPALLQGLLIRRFDRRRERRSGRLHRLSAIIGTLSGLRRNPVRNASDSATFIALSFLSLFCGPFGASNTRPSRAPPKRPLSLNGYEHGPPART